MLPSAPGVRDQVLHCVSHSWHAQGSLRSHEEGEVPDAGDDVRSRAGAPAEGEKEERTALSPRVALASPTLTSPQLAAQPLDSQAQPHPPAACFVMYSSFESLASLGWFCTPKTPPLVTRSTPKPVWLQAGHSLAICSTSSVGAVLGFGSAPPPIPHLAPSSRLPLSVPRHGFSHWKNLCNCNVYYADQGLQITTVHFWPPILHSLCVCVAASTPTPPPTRFDSAVWCSSQHGCVYLPWAPVGLLLCWSCERAPVVLNVSCCKSDSGDVATKYNGHCSCKATVYCPRSMLINICGHFVNLQRKKKQKTKIQRAALIVEDVNIYSIHLTNSLWNPIKCMVILFCIFW